MKKLYFLLILIYAGSVFSQSRSDISEILNVIVEKYKSDTVEVYYRFSNYSVLDQLEHYHLEQTFQRQESYGQLPDSIKSTTDIFSYVFGDEHDFLTLENLKINYSNNLKLAKKTQDKKLNRYLNLSFLKRKNKPYAYISIPILSADSRKALVYTGYNNGSLCGSGGVFFLEKINGVWYITRYQEQWIS